MLRLCRLDAVGEEVLQSWAGPRVENPSMSSTLDEEDSYIHIVSLTN